MIIFVIFVALVLLLPIAGLFPPVDWHGADVKNRIFRIGRAK